MAFDWLPYSVTILHMDDARIGDWLRETVEAGVCSVRTEFGRQLWEMGKLDRIQAFYNAFQSFAAHYTTAVKAISTCHGCCV